ncbi:Sau3AI family type II restriction endonuclease [Salinicoccus roseus]|uniref:Sau3AI family type II restriction endonuclease n=1 Tax=Salinicoccus roseus TaxID=45670 RepID=UPI003524D7BB
MAFEYETIDDLVSYAREAEGEYLKDIDKQNMLENTNVKGKVGTIIEASYFGYEVNSKPEPDFADVGVELKTTGLKKLKNGQLSAKERLVLNIINYEDEVKVDFEDSSFWKKNAKLLIFFYTYTRDKDGKPDYRNFQIVKTVLHEFTGTDLEIIKQDFEDIKAKILSGEAHMISEGDTNILGACTKGATSNSQRTQPYSEIPAKQRAFSLKQGYMTALVRKYIKDIKMISFTSPEELEGKTFEELLHDYFRPYIGKRDIDIADDLNYQLSRSKNKLALLASRILGIQGTSLNHIEEFSKLNIKFKTIRATKTGTMQESMSFGNVDYNEILQEDWEESSLKMEMESIKWLFIVFQEDEDGNPVLKGIKLWSVPESILDDEIRNFYNEVKRILQEGFEEWPVGKQRRNNFPKSGFNGVCHLRTKGTNREKSMVTLSDGQRIPGHAFWFNSRFIKNLVQELID